MLRSIFWNPSEQRLRAFIRFVLQFVLRLACLVGLARILALIATTTGDRPAESSWVYVLKEWNPRGVFLRFILATIEPLAAVTSAAIAFRFLDHRPFRDIGFRWNRQWWADYAFGLALGIACMAVVLGVGLATGSLVISGTLVASPLAGPLATAIALAVFANIGNGLEEELSDRAYLIRNASEGFTSRRVTPRTALVLAYALSAVMFGLAHMGRSAPPSAIVLLMLVGLFFGLPYVLTGELAISIGIHTTWNLAQTSLFGLAEGRSGTQGTLIAVRATPGAAFWLGDQAWGPESGIVTVIVCALGALAVFGWVRATRGSVALQAARFQWHPQG